LALYEHPFFIILGLITTYMLLADYIHILYENLKKRLKERRNK